MTYRPKLIEVALPLDAINEHAAHEKAIRVGHPANLHLWWARRPLAACRAILFAQYVDDPSGWPTEFPTEVAQDTERERLFQVIRDFVTWDGGSDANAIRAARLEIARSVARRQVSDGVGDDRDREVLRGGIGSDDLAAYLQDRVPGVHDPFAGGGAIPLEAQRLGLRVRASDLNPVAVLINRAMTELPGHYGLTRPLSARSGLHASPSFVENLAIDVKHFGSWMKGEAIRALGEAYSDVQVPNDLGGGTARVVAWVWARTVASPNPAVNGAHVPLVSSWWLSKKPGKEAWIDATPNADGTSYLITVRSGRPPDANRIDSGTKSGRGDFRCLLTGVPIPAEYVRAEGSGGRMGVRLIAIAAESPRKRVYLTPTDRDVALAGVALPENPPDTDLPRDALGFRVQNYGLTKHRHLFTPRQLRSMCALADLVPAARERAIREGTANGHSREDAERAADAVAVYLALAVSKTANRSSCLGEWMLSVECPGHVFKRSAISMLLDFAEANVLTGPSGSFESMLDNTVGAIRTLGTFKRGVAEVRQADAMVRETYVPGNVLSTDPPYYDNIPYADLSDFFYIWLRRALKDVRPADTATMLVPKAAELVAEPFRHGGKDAAERFFMEGMSAAMAHMAETGDPEFPTAIYYAFKQSETDGGGAASTGWETFLQAVVRSGFAVVGTWPVRTEREARARARDANALATSVVLVCRRRTVAASVVTRADFRRLLRIELPASLRHFQHGNIAPVDVAQAAIGPGMGVFSRHARVVEADGSAMSVRTALQLINEALDEFLSESEGDLDSDSRFAVSWFETYGYETGPFGAAENIAKGRNVSVSGVAEAGILTASAGKVRLHRRSELPAEWNPATDKHLTVWEATQHLIKRLEEEGEGPAAELLKALGPVADQARALAYRLYSACERRKWAEEARAYNGLVVAWPELERLAAQVLAAPAKPATKQGKLF